MFCAVEIIWELPTIEKRQREQQSVRKRQNPYEKKLASKF
jgi:hypothetical protein